MVTGSTSGGVERGPYDVIGRLTRGTKGRPGGV